jgi:hypothetical protein
MSISQCLYTFDIHITNYQEHLSTKVYYITTVFDESTESTSVPDVCELSLLQLLVTAAFVVDVLIFDAPAPFRERTMMRCSLNRVLKDI